jgi:signal peptidase I
MTLLQWFIFFLVVQVIHFAGTWRLYEKAGRKRWEAAVPVYNAIVLMQIIHRPKWWVILLFIPVVNLIMIPVVWVQTLQAFGKRSTTDMIIGIVTLGFYIYVINYDDKTTYNPEKEMADSTLGSLLFAVVVATIVHTYIMQPFTIPTASLEKTLLVGDFLFVSKFNYGARTPMTPVAAPMVHDSIPVVNTKSYSDWPQLPYFRLPGFEKIEKNDIVVFNWPIDTVKFFGDTKTVGLRKPIDKKSNYVKRCVGTPGDNLSIKDGLVYINGKELKLSDRASVQYRFIVETKGDVRSLQMKEVWPFYKIKKELWDDQRVQDFFRQKDVQAHLYEASRDSAMVEVTGFIGLDAMTKLSMQPLMNKGLINLTFAKRDELKKDPAVIDIKQFYYPGTREIFPHSKPQWSVDNMGPIYIPEAGKQVDLNAETLPFYKMIITEYEKNKLEVIGGQILINGQPANSYTFKQDYYWMMGDNRHNSEDSRFWGFVPADHIVGKPVFVWMSIDQNESWKNIGKKIRWDRMFTTVGGDGEPVSYFKYFLGALVIWFGYSYFRKRRNKAKG